MSHFRAAEITAMSMSMPAHRATGRRRSQAVSAQAVLRASTWLPSDTRSSAAARRFVAEQLAQWRYRGSHDDVLIVVTELVNNALIHAGSAVFLGLALTGGCLRLEVGDSSDSEPVRRVAGEDGGYGMQVVERLCSRWGVNRVEGGKIVWCECL